MAHVEFEAKASELREAIDLVKTSTGNALQSLQGASLSDLNIDDLLAIEIPTFRAPRGRCRGATPRRLQSKAAFES